MNNALKERLFVAVASHCANEGRAWALVDIVLAELAGELKDAERYRWLRAMNAFDKSAPQPPSGDWWNCVLSEKINDDFDKAIDEARHG